MSEEELEKVYVDLPNNSSVGGESLWARSLGGELYEIHNVPFYAYGLNYLDVVRTDARDETQKPVVLEFVEPSGYETLRVVFINDLDRESQRILFDELKAFEADVERANDRYVALSVAPDGDYDAVFDRLEELTAAGVLDFETCEAKVEGSFDKPDEDETEAGETEDDAAQ